MNIPSLAFNLKSYNTEQVFTNISFQRKKEQSQKVLSLNQLKLKLRNLMSHFNLDENFVNAADEMADLPTLKTMNMAYLAGALIFLKSVNNDEPTPENFNTDYTNRIIRGIYNENDDYEINVSEKEQLFNYIYTIYVYRYNK